jgi:hypothetical protein
MYNDKAEIKKRIPNLWTKAEGLTSQISLS